MFRRWHHGHSIGTGVLGGLLIAQHVFILAFCFLILGIVLGRIWHTSVMIAEAIREKVLRAKAEKIATAPVPVYRGQVIDDDTRWNDPHWPFRARSER